MKFFKARPSGFMERAMGIETTSESWKIWQRRWSGFCAEGQAFKSRRRLPPFYFAMDENPTFQIRSSWARFSRFERFQRFYFSITYVFSMNTNIPTPPASTISSLI
jgi:hypothetical protein